MLPCSPNIFGCSLGPKITPVALFTVRARNMGLNKVPYEKVPDSLAQSSPATKVGRAWSFLQTHKNHKENQTSAPSRRITYFIFGIPLTAFSHATTARAQYKWRTMVKDHLCAATARVNIYLLKGALLLSKRHWINKTAHVKRVSVTQKHTLRA